MSHVPERKNQMTPTEGTGICQHCKCNTIGYRKAIETLRALERILNATQTVSLEEGMPPLNQSGKDILSKTREALSFIGDYQFE